jgi:hypothetical protein
MVVTNTSDDEGRISLGMRSDDVMEESPGRFSGSLSMLVCGNQLTRRLTEPFSWGRTSTCLPAMYDGKKFIATKSPKRHHSGVEASRKAWKTEARGAPVRGDGASTGNLLTNIFEKTINDRGASIGAEAPALVITCRLWPVPSSLYGVASAATKLVSPD